MSEWRVSDGGAIYAPAQHEILEKRLTEADKPGEHLWCVTAAWRLLDPESAFASEPTPLDAENLVVLAGPVCFKCEQPYSRRIARKPCRGSIDLQ